ncbi:MAG: hypothetical protein WCA78_15225 [Rhizomicrobium sp.]
MTLTPEQICVLEAIRDEWNRAEGDIKLAEQVCNEIVFPSINELRYGGRRVIDVVHGVLTHAPQNDIDGWLADAKFDCHRARHDAIDTATSKIAITIENMVGKLQYEAILPAFPEFPALVNHLGDVRKRIVESRKGRENREALYTAIEGADFPSLVDRYRRLLECEPIMRRLALRNRWRDAGAIVAIILGIAALAVAFL